MCLLTEFLREFSGIVRQAGFLASAFIYTSGCLVVLSWSSLFDLPLFEKKAVYDMRTYYAK